MKLVSLLHNTGLILCDEGAGLGAVIDHLITFHPRSQLVYGRCSKMLNTSCLPKRPRQTAQTQLSSPVYYSGPIDIFIGKWKEKSVQDLRNLPFWEDMMVTLICL